MAFQPCPGIAEVAMHFTWQGEDCYNIFHVDNQAGDEWTSAQLTTLVGEFGTWWGASLAPLQSSTVVLAEIKARDLTSQTGNEVTGAFGGAGSIGTATLPNNCTIAVKWSTGLAGRSARGRTFHIGLVEAQVSGNSILATPEASLRTAYQALITAIDGAAVGKLAVLSRQFNGVKRAEGVGIQILTATFTDGFLDSQRRRLPRK